ncbi:MAG: ATP-binding protein [Candidatus Thorarchaeota archaeon]
MEEHDDSETTEPLGDDEEEGPHEPTPPVKEPVKLIPKSVLTYHPRVSEHLELLTDEELGVVLGRSKSFHSKYSESGLGMLGAVSETTDDVLTSYFGMPVSLDLMSPHVLFVAGKRGSGKSYTLGTIAEELALAMERQEIEVAAVVIDTVDVFRQMIDANDEQSELLAKWNLKPRGFPAAVYIPKTTYNSLPDEVKKKAHLYPLAISPRELTSSDWGYILEKGGQLSTTMDNLIGDVLEGVRQGYVLESGAKLKEKRDFSIRDMITCIESNPRITELYQLSTRTALVQRLRRADRLGVFHTGGTSAQDLAVGGQITIIDVAPLGSDAEAVLAILTNMLCRQVLTYRMAWTDEGTSAREELPPTWLIIDEAHTLVPRSGSTPAKDAIIGYAKLGRRFGCSLVLCTQQPSAVSDDAISQADLIISHSLSHDNDIRALQQRAPAVMPEQFRDKVFISSLPRGVAIVFDQATENKRGFIMHVRPRASQHGGSDRLSGLFEAARLRVPQEHEDVEELPEDEILDESQEEVDLPEVPRPPLNLSEEDWKVLDDWMQQYVEALFTERMQEFRITSDPAPRVDVGHESEPIPKEPFSSDEVDVDIELDFEHFIIRDFAPLQRQLLNKAMTRKVLYSPESHEFLFGSQVKHRETESVESVGADPLNLLKRVLAVLVASGLKLVDTIEEDGFSFAFLRADGIRASVSAGVSVDAVSIPVVIVGDNQKKVTSIADKLRTAQGR